MKLLKINYEYCKTANEGIKQSAKPYSDAMHMCADGMYIYAMYKFVIGGRRAEGYHDDDGTAAVGEVEVSEKGLRRIYITF